MRAVHSASLEPNAIVRTLRVYWRRWLVPAALVATAGVAYAVLHSDTWEASQSLIVRNEAATATRDTAPGKFRQPEDMKTVQETIFELARSRGVLEAALREVGPPRNYRKSIASWPSVRDIEDLRDVIKLEPPKGAEFGKTEVFYLKVRDKERARAIALSQVICTRLQSRFQQLRDVQAQSMIDELAKAVQVARDDLADSTARLTEVESEVGGDLAELRALGDSVGGETAVQRTLGEIRAELRTVRSAIEGNTELLTVLHDANQDSGRLLAAPSSLLESQPGLKRLKEGLVEAQLETARLAGKMSAEHPLMIAAEEAEEEIGRHLHNELAIAKRGLEVDLKLNRQREKLLETRLAEASARLDRLAAVRASYSNLLAEANHRTKLLETAEQNLSEARAAQASATASSLIAALESPDVGSDPVGPGRATIALLGCLGGLLVGFGVVMLTVQPQPTEKTATEEESASNGQEESSLLGAFQAGVSSGSNGHNGHNGHGAAAGLRTPPAEAFPARFTQHDPLTIKQALKRLVDQRRM
ncbi:MAG: hypothetical protein ACOY3P_05465 [Planctomycetota bacterium]